MGAARRVKTQISGSPRDQKADVPLLQTALGYCIGNLDHKFFRKVGNAQTNGFRRDVKTLNVLLKQKNAVSGEPDAFENTVSIQQTVVKHAQGGLMRVADRSVDAD